MFYWVISFVTLGSSRCIEKVKHLWFTYISSVFLKIPGCWDVMLCHWWLSPNICKHCSVFIFRVKQSKKTLKSESTTVLQNVKSCSLKDTVSHQKSRIFSRTSLKVLKSCMRFLILAGLRRLCKYCGPLTSVEDWGSLFLWNIGTYLQDYMVM